MFPGTLGEDEDLEARHRNLYTAATRASALLVVVGEVGQLSAGA